MAFPNTGKSVAVGISIESLLEETVSDIVEDDEADSAEDTDDMVTCDDNRSGDADERSEDRDENSVSEELYDDTTTVVSSGAAPRSVSEEDEDEDDEERTCRAEGSYATCCSRKCARSVEAGQAYLCEFGIPARNPVSEPMTKLNNPRKTGFLGNFLTCCMCVFISYYYTTKLHKYQ